MADADVLLVQPGDDVQQGDGAEAEGFVEADWHLSSGDVVQRIEECVAGCIEDLCQDKVPELQLVSRAAHLATLVPDAAPNVEGGTRSLRMRWGVQTKSLMKSNGASALSYARLFKVLEAVHCILISGQTITERELWYQFQVSNPTLFRSTRDVGAAIQDVVALLRVPRPLLGINCCSRGAVAGSLSVKDSPDAAWQDCGAVGQLAGKTIPGNLAAIEQCDMQCQGRFIIVVEKDAIFQRLVEARMFDQVPCILLTAKGMPDVATRAFLRKLHSLFPAVPVTALVDWNPSGVAIIKTYKHGSARTGLEASSFAVPSLSWLGVRSVMLQQTERASFQQLTARDKAMIPTLKEHFRHAPQWVRELDTMLRVGLKADIEAVCNIAEGAAFKNLLCHMLLQRNYLA